MKGYRVTFIKPKVAELRSFELRKPKDNEVMVKVKYTLISAGTEKAYLSGANNTAQKFPTVPGYSSVGCRDRKCCNKVQTRRPCIC